MTPRRLAVLAIFVVAACGSGTLSGPPPTAPPGGAAIVAAQIAFDRDEIDVPAGQAFDLLVENRDAIPHNVAIVGTDGNPVYVGEVFTGPGSKTYAIPALAAGRYSFRCDVHPLSMVGEVVAG